MTCLFAPSLTGILSAAAVLTMLAGCTAYDRTKDQFVQPVVKDVKKGMSRVQVAQIAGKPSSEVSMIHARGTCQTYILGQRDGKAETYFVALDDTGHVINSGYQTCAEYDTDPQAAKK
ncbi:osmotically-inducible lipoprotein OsmE [Citrobacter portucalensis]|uniref:osmotically-inducible lipoprotein OsmE n=1 Tax=Citrobacter portucalensis TaxID=1639133 RepID=UPI001B8291F9